MDLKYVAAVIVFARSVDVNSVPLVAELLDERHQPVVVLNVTLVNLSQR